MKLIDISHELSQSTPVYPGDYKISLTEYKTIKKDGHELYLLQSGFHTGTHLDMPMHLLEDNRTAADFPIDCFMGNGVLIDVRGEKELGMKPEYKALIHSQDIVLFLTGWDEFYAHEKYFTDYPVMSEELAEFLCMKRIKLLGIDMPAPDYYPFPVHKTLLSESILLLENLTNLQALIGVGKFEVMAFPMKVCAEASFVRAVCRIME